MCNVVCSLGFMALEGQLPTEINIKAVVTRLLHIHYIFLSSNYNSFCHLAFCRDFRFLQIVKTVNYLQFYPQSVHFLVHALWHSGSRLLEEHFQCLVICNICKKKTNCFSGGGGTGGLLIYSGLEPAVVAIRWLIQLIQNFSRTSKGLFPNTPAPHCWDKIHSYRITDSPRAVAIKYSSKRVLY